MLALQLLYFIVLILPQTYICSTRTDYYILLYCTVHSALLALLTVPLKPRDMRHTAYSAPGIRSIRVYMCMYIKGELSILKL